MSTQKPVQFLVAAVAVAIAVGGYLLAGSSTAIHAGISATSSKGGGDAGVAGSASPNGGRSDAGVAGSAAPNGGIR